MGTTTNAAPAARSEVMRRVKSRDTGPERRVAELLEAMGLSFRHDAADLSGRPDFVVEGGGRRLAIFVHGCWWHGHDCRRGARVPKTNREYWLNKVARNRRRDRRVSRQLRLAGYSVWVVWECRLRKHGLPHRLQACLEQIAAEC